MVSAVVAALHVLALGLGLPAVFLRGRALRGVLDAGGLRRLFVADNLWGLAAVLWLGTGLLRAFGGLEKGTDFYLRSHLFWLKMALFVTILLLEAWPMWTFMRWRLQHRQGRAVDPRHARAFFVLNHVQMALVVAMAFVASFMARGFGVG